MHTKSPEFLKVNPNGHIPSIDDDGLVLHESLAINLYLAKKHGGPLAPADVAEDGQMTMWALWAATEVETARDQHRLPPRQQRRPADGSEDRRRSGRGAARPLRRARRRRWPDGYLVGGRFTVADINVAEVVRYAQAAPELFDAAPRVKAWLAACQARPAFKKMWAARDSEPA